MNARTDRFNEAVRFFYRHAGFGYDPKTETREQGRRRCAQALAEAEQWARDNNLGVGWEVDPDTDSRDFSDETPPWSLWQAALTEGDGTVLASLGGVDFGRDGNPHTEPYGRVVEAELALEALEQHKREQAEKAHTDAVIAEARRYSREKGYPVEIDGDAEVIKSGLNFRVAAWLVIRRRDIEPEAMARQEEPQDAGFDVLPDEKGQPHDPDARLEEV